METAYTRASYVAVVEWRVQPGRFTSREEGAFHAAQNGMFCPSLKRS